MIEGIFFSIYKYKKLFKEKEQVKDNCYIT